MLLRDPLMTSDDPLQSRYPAIGRQLPTVSLAQLPTPVSRKSLALSERDHAIWIKHDEQTGQLYGGNKVRKLEYLFGRLLRQQCRQVATFGAVGSNHAIATALYARSLGLEPVCLLSHQTRTPLATRALHTHLQNGSRIIAYGGTYAERLGLLRSALWNRRAGVIPMGGSSWLGSVGFVAAGLELADQVAGGVLPAPDRIYLASGTMGTAAGLALGLALAGLDTTVHAVQVSHPSIANEPVFRRLVAKCAAMLHRLDPSFPADLGAQVRWVLRPGYFAPGYARSNSKTDAALGAADLELGLKLEPTYTGKALAALIDDWPAIVKGNERVVFWNTYSDLPQRSLRGAPAGDAALPPEFLRYLD